MTDLRVLSNVFDSMASTAEDRGKDTFGINVTVEDGFTIAKLASDADTYRWHYLVDDRNDLPGSGLVIVAVKGSDCIFRMPGETIQESIERMMNKVIVTAGYYDPEEGWLGADGYPMVVLPYKWKEIDRGDDELDG